MTRHIARLHWLTLTVGSVIGIAGPNLACAELVGHWTFNETLENAIDGRGEVEYLLLDEDQSGQNPNAPVFVEGPPELEGQKAIAFGGPTDPENDGGKDGDLIRVTSDTGLADVSAGNDWAITGWFRIDVDPLFGTPFLNDGKAGLFINDVVSGGDERQFGVGLEEVTPSEFRLVHNHAGIGSDDTSLTVVPGKWYFTAQVSNELEDTLTLYLYESGASELESETVGPSSPLDLSAIQEISIGANSCCPDRLFDGGIADVRIYSRGLTQDDLLDLVGLSSSLVPEPSTLVGGLIAASLVPVLLRRRAAA